MKPRIRAVAGPLDEAELAEVGALYGRADPKYLRADVLEHLFVSGPAGPAFHSLAFVDERLVGHIALVPMPGRVDGRRLTTGKAEALFVDEAHRGSRGGARPLVFDLVDAVYDLAGRNGVEPLHAFVRPEVGRVLRFEPVPAGRPTLVAVTGKLPVGAPGGRAAVALRAATTSLSRLVRTRRGALRDLTGEDRDLIDVPPPPPGSWTVAADDLWEWCLRSPLLRVLEVDRSRLLVQLPGSEVDALRLVGRRSGSSSTRETLRDVAALTRLARELGASTLRFQPWAGTGPELARACRLLGFVRRGDFTTLHVRDAARWAGVAPTPLLYLGF